MSYVKDLDAPLLKLSPGTVFTCRSACGGVHFFGGIGGGKSSAAQVIAGAYLRAGMGGVVTISKFEDIALWKDRYAPHHGRSNSVVLFDENEGFNFLNYEMARQGMEGVTGVTECLMRVIDAARKATATTSPGGENTFWQDAPREPLRYCLPLLYSAKGSLSIPDIIRFISTAPAHLKEPTNRKWQDGSFMYGVVNAACNRPVVPMERAALQNAIDYWEKRWPAIPPETRGNIVITVSTTLDRFNHGRLNRAFCGKTTVVPELSFHGGIILLAMPTLTWNEDGVIAQTLFKFFWQRAVLSRNRLEKKHRERFVFLWSDEAQETVNGLDGEFLSLCRASKCCTVYLTQSLPNYYVKIGKDAAHTLAGKFMTHVYCANGCPETNEFAARTLGKVVRRRANASSGSSENVTVGMSEGGSENSGSSSNYGWSSGSSSGQSSSGTNSGTGRTSGTGTSRGVNRGRGTGRTVSRGYSESLEYAMEPGDFARELQTGGPQNGHIVTAVWFQAGRIFEASGTNWLLARFRQ